MARHVHVHLTQDGGWDESKHPRKDDGKFGSGSGVASAGKKEYRGRESGPAPGSKGEADLVKAGGPLSEKDKADIEAFAKQQLAKKLGLTRADLKAQAKAEYEAANKGKGSYHKAAELYEQAGSAEKAAEARALAKRYKHDPEGQSDKSKADLSEARLARKEAEKSDAEHDIRLWGELADAFEKRAKDPENQDLTDRISALRDRLAYRSAVKRSDGGGR
jgi:hypothetical protein